jgi:hypothetical protein
VHLVRYATDHTRDLPLEAAAHADRLLTRDPSRLTRSRIRALVDEARLYHDPDRAVAEEENALAARRVDLHPGSTPATTDVVMSLDTPDAEAFDRTLVEIAAALKALGDDDGLEVRRARAVGVLADPQRALDLLDHGVAPDRNRLGATGTKDPVLWLHLDETDLQGIDTYPAAVRCDRLGTLSSDLLRMWLPDTTLIIKPVRTCHHAGPDRSGAVDAHDPPEAMAEEVRLRDPECVFPGCHRPSQHCDLDHIEPYLPLDQGGPPGQTHTDGLAPLCRRHHRLKTHTAWTYRRLPDGSYRWTTPTGHTHDVPPPRRR